MANGDDGNAMPFVKGPFGESDFFQVDSYRARLRWCAVEFCRHLARGRGQRCQHLAVVRPVRTRTVYGLEFALSSSDNGTFGMNTPAYFAMDSLSVTAVPLAGRCVAVHVGARCARPCAASGTSLFNRLVEAGPGPARMQILANHHSVT